MSCMRYFALAVLVTFALAACDRSPEATLASAEQSILDRDYRTALVVLKAVLQREPENARARWLLGGLYLEIEDGASAEKELRQAGLLGVAEEAVIPALSQALLMQHRPADVLALSPAGQISALSRAEFDASRALALAANGETDASARAIEAALGAAPLSPWVRFAKANLLVASNEIEAAKTVLESLVADVPSHGRAWSLLGQIHAGAQEFADAEAAFTKALEYRSRSSADLLGRGIARMAQGDVAGLYEDASLLSGAAPKWYQSGYLMGLARLQRGEYAEAADAFEAAVAANDRHYESTFFLAATHRRLGNHSRALLLAEAAHALGPDRVSSRKLLASLYLQEQRASDAERLLRPVVVQRPDDLSAVDMLATSLIQQKRFREAAELLVVISAQRQDDARAQARSGAVLLAAGEREKGREAIGQAQDLAKEDAAVHRMVVASLLDSQMHSEALDAASVYVEVAKDDPMAWRLLGAAHAAAGQTAEARAAFQRTIGLAPGDPVATGQLAAMALREDQIAEARTLLEQGLQKHPGDSRLLYMMAEVELRDGSVVQSVAMLERSIAADKAWLAPRITLARVLLGEGDAARALELVREAGASNEQVSLIRAAAHIQLQQFADAQRILEARSARLPNAPENYFLLAKLYAETGSADQLEASLQQLLKLAPDSIEAKLIMARFRAAKLQFAEAKAVLDGLDESLQDSAALLDARLFLARKRGDIQEELAFAERLLRVQQSPANLVSYATALARSGQTGLAVAKLASAWAAQPSELTVGTALSELYIASNRADQGAEVLRQLAASHPENTAVLNNLAWVLRDLDQAEALRYAERAHEQSPRNPAVLDTFAELLVRNRQVERGLSMIDRAIELSDGNLQLRVRRAELLRLSGDQRRAVDSLDELIADSSVADEERRAIQAIRDRWEDE